MTWLKRFLAKIIYQSRVYGNSKAMACGTEPSRPDERDFKVSTEGIKQTSSTSKFLSQLTPVKNQGKLQCCASCSLVGNFEQLMLINNPQKYIELSELYHYNRVRLKINNTFPQDKGQTIRDGCQAMLKYGNALEVTFPFVVSDVNKDPNVGALFVSSLYKIDAYHFCELISDVIKMIDNDVPVSFGLKITESFYDINYKKAVYNPKKGEKEVGGHAQKIVGYDVNDMAFLVENSWGTQWGSNGYYWLPFDVYNKRAFDAVVLSVDKTGYAGIKRT